MVFLVLLDELELPPSTRLAQPYVYQMSSPGHFDPANPVASGSAALAVVPVPGVYTPPLPPPHHPAAATGLTPAPVVAPAPVAAYLAAPSAPTSTNPP